MENDNIKNIKADYVAPATELISLTEEDVLTVSHETPFVPVDD